MNFKITVQQNHNKVYNKTISRFDGDYSCLRIHYEGSISGKTLSSNTIIYFDILEDFAIFANIESSLDMRLDGVSNSAT